MEKRDLSWGENHGLESPISCAVIKDNSILMVSSHHTKGKWVLPKGGWESDETALEAAKRETFEEAGVINTFVLSFVGGRGHWRKHLNCNISKQAQEARPLDALPDGMHKDL